MLRINIRCLESGMNYTGISEDKLLEMLDKKGYENLSEEEKGLYQQLEVMIEAEFGYDYYEDERDE